MPETTSPQPLAGPPALDPGPLPRPVRRTPRRERLTIAGLLLLSAVPVLAAASRTAELASRPEVTEANERFVTAPVPVLVHVLAGSVFLVLGTFQMQPVFRRHHLRGHRRTGRVAAPAGLAAALSGVWLTLSSEPPVGDGPLLTAFRLAAGSLMAVAVVLAVAAVLRGDVATHRAWMMRAYALGLGAGTQVLTLGGFVATGAEPGEVARALLMALGWVLNLAVAEVVIRRGRAPSRGARPGTVVPAGSPRSPR